MGAGNNSREMETDAAKDEERERWRANIWRKERGRERYEIDTPREGNTEREAKKAKPETGRIKGRDRGRGSPSAWAECQRHLPRPSSTPSGLPQSPHLLGGPRATCLPPASSDQPRSGICMTQAQFSVVGTSFSVSPHSPGWHLGSPQLLATASVRVGHPTGPEEVCPQCLSFPRNDKIQSLSKCSGNPYCVPGLVHAC